MTYRMNDGQWNTQPWNGQAHLAGILGDVPVFYNQRTVELTWGTVPGTKYYSLQVSLYPDFRTNFVDTVVQISDYSYTDSQTDNVKRYWRWRPSVSSGADFLAPWSDVGSYWLNTGAAAEIEVPEDYWVIFDKDNVNDIYFFELSPIFQIKTQNINRFMARNRAGTLLTEFLTAKDQVTLSFEGSQWIFHPQMDELTRFHVTKRVFFLATYSKYKRDIPIPQIWKVEFADDPSFAMFNAGRPDMVHGTVTFLEV